MGCCKTKTDQQQQRVTIILRAAYCVNSLESMYGTACTIVRAWLNPVINNQCHCHYPLSLTNIIIINVIMCGLVLHVGAVTALSAHSLSLCQSQGPLGEGVVALDLLV